MRTSSFTSTVTLVSESEFEHYAGVQMFTIIDVSLAYANNHWHCQTNGDLDHHPSIVLNYQPPISRASQ